MSVTPNSDGAKQEGESNRYDAQPKSLLSHLLDAVLEQVGEPKIDLEQNLKSALAMVIKRYDLVTREEFALQQQSLKAAKAQLDELKRLLDESSAT